MDFSITPDNDGIPQMSWTKETTVSTNVFYTFNVRRGTFFQNPTFGIDLSDIKKVTDNTVELIKERLINACSWLLGVGRAKSIDVIVEKDTTDITRINYKVDITQADGFPVTVTDFITVGGASDDFPI